MLLEFIKQIQSSPLLTSGVVSAYIFPPIFSLLAGLSLAGIALLRHRPGRTHIYFAITCLWWVMLSPVFISHHIFSDQNLILKIERWVHFFFVYIPFINILFFSRLLKFRAKILKPLSLGICALISLGTFSDYYFYGLDKYSWGYIAKGGPLFSIFLAYSAAISIVIIIQSLMRIRSEKNPFARLRAQYVSSSLIIGGGLSIFNIPAIYGYDVYPFGNLLFIPLFVLAYGIFRHQLLNLRDVFNKSILWGLIGSFHLIPNIILYFFLYELVIELSPVIIFPIIMAWFYINIYYYNRVRLKIDVIFNRGKFDLARIEHEYTEQIYHLQNLKELVEELTITLKAALRLPDIYFYYREVDTEKFTTLNGEELELSPRLHDWFLDNHQKLTERGQMDDDLDYSMVTEEFHTLFEIHNTYYAQPLVDRGWLIGLILMPPRASLRTLTELEKRFLAGVKTSTSIAAANSRLYQNISSLKDSLEERVQERTKQLRNKTEEMLFELRIARDVQQSLLPPGLTHGEGINISARLDPLMEVSGDYYEITRLDDQRYAIMLVDVSGHGVPSALLTVLVRSEFNKHRGNLEDPAEVAAKLNASLTPEMIKMGFFFTMVLAVVDLKENYLRYTNCGHPEPILVNSDASWEYLPTTDCAVIGASSQAEFRFNQLDLNKGGRIILYTDGILEARNSEGKLFSEEAFPELIRNNAGLPGDELLNVVFEQVSAFQTTSRIMDDKTLIIIDIT